MTKRKKVLITPAQNMEMRAMAQLTGVPEEEVTNAYVKSFITGVKPYHLLYVVKATMEAERDGRDFTPIYWYRTDDGVLHITMWDMTTGVERQIRDAQTLASFPSGFRNRGPK